MTSVQTPNMGRRPPTPANQKLATLRPSFVLRADSTRSLLYRIFSVIL